MIEECKFYGCRCKKAECPAYVVLDPYIPEDEEKRLLAADIHPDAVLSGMAKVSWCIRYKQEVL